MCRSGGRGNCLVVEKLIIFIEIGQQMPLYSVFFAVSCGGTGNGLVTWEL